jgi:xylulokinase
MSNLIGIDIGTTNVKIILISSLGKIIATETNTYPIYSPQHGWSEQNPNDWWNATKKTLKKLIKENDVNPLNIAAISLTGQMHSLVMLDKNKKVIRPAILWNDTRTNKQCKEIYNKIGGLEELISVVSNPALEGFTAPKLLWIRENEPENYKKIKHIIMPKDFVRYKLTSEIKSEVSDNAGTLLFDVKNKKWSSKILEVLNIDKSILPESLNSTDIAGYITNEVKEVTGLKEGTPVLAGGADNACGALGSGIIKDGRVMVSIGTSGVVLAQSSRPTPDKKGRIHLFNHAYPNKYYMMGVMLSAASSFNWLKEKMYDNRYSIDNLNQLAEKSKPGSNGIIFLPYLNGERTPHADPNAKGVFFGLSYNHEVKDIVRSTMEGVAFGLKDSYELIKEKEIEIEQIRLIGGGAKSNLWCQIIADVFKKEVNLINIEEGPAFGAALIAGVGIDIFENFEEAEKRFIKVVKTIHPDQSNYKIYDHNYNIYQSLYKSLKENFAQHSLSS